MYNYFTLVIHQFKPLCNSLNNCQWGIKFTSTTCGYKAVPLSVAKMLKSAVCTSKCNEHRM